ncbi:alcohol dehydrogenase catalytic domain-containing protein [Evansella tamaricis]|uniref:Alcohol dehydrogenase catalytic domain-containing protein n=1 Tax=Evansella tamaricis TaxID=2069301 RepID=A0ABS6J9L2_9BACI|nr:alcohol dehydrogenase catalytic domain-containing protein [Evansella tamaricis]MBU9710368.1 alcohol dehydrogenase catalytic domain-containing protein [Evansella tamaricis]
MRAITYQGMRQVMVQEVPEPQIENNDDAIVRITACSICGSDLHCYHGFIPSMEKGTVVGHEGIGIVEEVGSDVTNVKKGDKVIIPFNIGCGECFFCKNKLESLCSRSNNYELGGAYGCSRLYGHYQGVQGELVKVPFANYNPIVVPEDCELTDDVLVLLTDALPTSLWGVENARVKHGDTVIVIGSGPIGLLTQKLAWLYGAERVIAVDCVDSRLEHGRKTNKVEGYNFRTTNDLSSILKETTGGGADVVIDCVGMSGKITALEMVETALRLQGGAMGSLEMATQVVRKGGTIQLIGVYGTRYNFFPLGDLFARNITLKMGVAPVTHLIPNLLQKVQSDWISPADIISHHMRLEDGEKAYKLFDKNKEECLKIILQP